MRRNVGPAASVRLAAASFGLLALTAPAIAGDAASFAAHGFSADGRYFAFEEFGYQDGSGFPYSNIYILDVTEDKWAGNSPYRVRLEEEANTLSPVRLEALSKSAFGMGPLGITEPAIIEALNGDGEEIGDGRSLSFGVPGYGLEAARDPVTLSLSTFEAKSSEPCVESYGFEPPVGFALTQANADGTSKELHRDTSVPSSRGCTVDYRLYAVVAPVGWQWNALTPVAIVSVYANGFEGPDRRFIAVPLSELPW